MDIKVYRDNSLPSRISNPDKKNFQTLHFDKKHILTNRVKNLVILYSYTPVEHCKKYIFMAFIIGNIQRI